MQVDLPTRRFPHEAAVLREETTSSRLSFETEIDQFRLEDKGEEQEKPMVQASNLGEKPDRSSIVCPSELIVTCIDSSSKEEDKMPLDNRKKGLHELLAGKVKRSVPKDTSGSQVPPVLPPPPSSINPFAPANFKKRKKDKEVAEEGEMIPFDEGVPPKLPKMTKGKGRASSIESKKVKPLAEVHPPAQEWIPQLEMGGTAIPWNSSIMEFQRGNAYYVANALEQPLLLPKDMATLKNMRQQDLFLSLKRDLALVSFWLHLPNFMLGSSLFFYFIIIDMVFPCSLVVVLRRPSRRSLWLRNG